jgi:transcriptional regulator with XRE-family HTH domain
MEIKLAEVLKRELKGKELKALSKELGIPLSNLHAWINGILPNGKNFKNLVKLADYLGLSLDELLLNRKSTTDKAEIITTTIFKDGRSTYRVSVEKV